MTYRQEAFELGRRERLEVARIDRLGLVPPCKISDALSIVMTAPAKMPGRLELTAIETGRTLFQVPWVA